MNTSFLESVAAHFAAAVEKDGPLALKDTVFVLPNKRSAVFLKEYMMKALRGTAILPRFTNLQRMMADMAGTPVMDARQRLFLLYDQYRRILTQNGRQEDIKPFDRFIFWGQMILSDFDEIDSSLCDATQLFTNLSRLKEIRADYLTDDQKKIVEELWGANFMTQTPSQTEFWFHDTGDLTKGHLGRSFTSFWDMLSMLYRAYHAELERMGCTSPGGVARKACNAIKENAAQFRQDPTQYALIGLGRLGVAETLLLRKLRENPRTLFFWDFGAPSLHALADSGNHALRKIRSLSQKFKAPHEQPPVQTSPHIDITGIPSNIGQAKEMGNILRQWIREGIIDPQNAINTAIILPDPALLIPVLTSVPEEITAMNITMGLPFRHTTFATLFTAIVDLQRHARLIRGEYHYQFRDIAEILKNPYIRVVASQEARDILDAVKKLESFYVPVSVFASFPGLASLFLPLKDLHNSDESAQYMARIVDWLHDSLLAVLGDTSLAKAAQGKGLAVKFEITVLERIAAEIKKIKTMVAQYGITLNDVSFFTLFDRILNATSLSVSGTPLKGLQIMGILETRALDFENVIILSLNERIFPSKQYTHSLIPATLRSAYGLDDREAIEGYYGYAFHRLLGRAQRVVLTYDSRTSGISSGEMSRYLTQIKYLLPRADVSFGLHSFPAKRSGNEPLTIAKTTQVMDMLNRFRQPGGKSLSASALKSYRNCPLQFFLKYVCDFRGSDDPTDDVSAATLGTTLHEAIDFLYEPYRNQLIDNTVFDRWLAPDCPEIDAAVKKAIYKNLLPRQWDRQSGECIGDMDSRARIMSVTTRYTIVKMLETERESFGNEGFTFIDTEKSVASAKGAPQWQLLDPNDDFGGMVNFKMSIDRVDRIANGHLRFIDFKTGNDKDAIADAPHTIFDRVNRSNHDMDAVFQLLVYCQAYGAMVDPQVKITPYVYLLKAVSAVRKFEPVRCAKVPVLDYREVSDDFLPALKSFVGEIFSPEIDITQAETDEGCQFCQFRGICGRDPKPKF